jgi:hypothetical protein
VKIAHLPFSIDNVIFQARRDAKLCRPQCATGNRRRYLSESCALGRLSARNAHRSSPPEQDEYAKIMWVSTLRDGSLKSQFLLFGDHREPWSVNVSLAEQGETSLKQPRQQPMLIDTARAPYRALNFAVASTSGSVDLSLKTTPYILSASGFEMYSFFTSHATRCTSLFKGLP